MGQFSSLVQRLTSQRLHHTGCQVLKRRASDFPKQRKNYETEVKLMYTV